MATFDQRGQKVNTQYNASGNINFSAATTSTDVVIELRKLLDEINQAVQAGNINSEGGIDVEAKVKKAIVQMEKPKPDKQAILENINGAKEIIESMASAVGLVSGFAQAVEVIRRIF